MIRAACNVAARIVEVWNTRFYCAAFIISAELALSVDGDTRSCVATGDGPVDAIFNAARLREAIG